MIQPEQGAVKKSNLGGQPTSPKEKPSVNKPPSLGENSAGKIPKEKACSNSVKTMTTAQMSTQKRLVLSACLSLTLKQTYTHETITNNPSQDPHECCHGSASAGQSETTIKENTTTVLQGGPYGSEATIKPQLLAHNAYNELQYTMAAIYMYRYGQSIRHATIATYGSIFPI